MKIRYVYLNAFAIPKSTYYLDDTIFLIPVQKIDTNHFYSGMLLCTTNNRDFHLWSDFGIYHALITGEREILKNWSTVKEAIKQEEVENKEDFIDKNETFISDSLNPGNPDFEKYEPIFASPLKINYAEGFQNFVKARTDQLKIFEQIRLFVFASGFDDWQMFYHNQNLKDSLYYTVFDSLIGLPKQCSNKYHCDVCSRSDISHNEESLANYQERMLSTILNKDIKNNFIQLVKRINRKRGATYHNASYFNCIEEWVEENRRQDKTETKEDTWTFERVIQEFDTHVGREMGSSYFSNLIKILLILKLFNKVELK